ncbi:MAG: DNA-protecting protein DprA [Chromatiales bacterium]|nr:DNA-protecting protein DprA [Chromatiales bacterium]
MAGRRPGHGQCRFQPLRPQSAVAGRAGRASNGLQDLRSPQLRPGRAGRGADPHARQGSQPELIPPAGPAAGIGPAAGSIVPTETWLSRPENHRLTPADAAYPALLREIPSPPPQLFVRGNLDALSLPQLAIVGSRNATPGGTETAHSFASHLAARGFCITSGLAEGIDAAAHRGALAARGTTIAVCGTGPDIVYPRQHATLAEEIVAGGGAIVSEFAPGTQVFRANFPRRNRLISGLAVGTLVVEASLRSGALITARHAMEQGREVFAIPGSIHNPVARGCHHLIRNGAKLVETAADIVDELGGLLASLRRDDAAAGSELALEAAPGNGAGTVESDADYARLLACLAWDPVDVDTLVARSGLTIGEVSSMLLLLEMRGSVRALTGGRYQRAGKPGSVDT